MSYNRWMPEEYSTELYHHGCFCSSDGDYWLGDDVLGKPSGNKV